MPADPLEILAGHGGPRRPGVHLSVALQRRLERELGVPPVPAQPPMGTIGGQVGIVYVKTADADASAAFFAELFGWESDRFQGDGFVSHYVVNTATLTVLTEDGEADGLFFPVADVGAAVALMQAAGGSVRDDHSRPDGGGFASAEDDQHFGFGLWRPDGIHQGPAPTGMPTGEVGYLTIDVPDPDRARAFYRAAFGWDTDAAHPVAADSELPFDFRAVDGPPGVHLFFRVSDIGVASSALRALGGRAEHPVAAGRAGLSAECTDPLGQPLTLWEPAPGF